MTALASSHALAKMGSVEGEAGPVSLSLWSHDRLSLGVGSTLMVSNETAAGVGLSLLYRLGEPDSNCAVEFGGMWPATVPTDFQSVHQVINGDFYDARVDSIGEAHFAVRYGLPHGTQKVFVPDVALGVSVLQISNEINIAPGTGPNTEFQAETDSETSWSPLIQIGFRLFPQSRVSFSFDAAYVHYGNTPSRGPSFDLGISGWMLRPMLQVRL